MALYTHDASRSEKLAFVETYFDSQGTKSRWTTKERSRSVWTAISPFLCLAALYGCYVHYGSLRSHSTEPTELHHHAHDQTYASNYTCIPGQACWPSSSQWSGFNLSIDGNLRTTTPWAAPCYSSNSSDSCHKVATSYGDAVARTAQYGSMEFLNWETCGQSSCILNSLDPSSPVSGDCSLGRLSTYYVEAHTPEDIKKTLDFVRRHGIRLSIKNTGHDYFGRSNAANSLAIWTYNMKDTRYHKIFQPQRKYRRDRCRHTSRGSMDFL
jgi:hypothetical protein